MGDKVEFLFRTALTFAVHSSKVFICTDTAEILAITLFAFVPTFAALFLVRAFMELSFSTPCLFVAPVPLRGILAIVFAVVVRGIGDNRQSSVVSVLSRVSYLAGTAAQLVDAAGVGNKANIAHSTLF